MVGEISFLHVLNKAAYPKLTICRPNRSTIGNLKDIYNLQLTLRGNAINELSFTIPVNTTHNHQLTINPLIDKLKDRYHIKVDFENQVEYFILLDINKEFSSDGKSITYTAYSCAKELADKEIRSFLEESQPLSHHAREMLSESNWRLDYVDAAFDTKYRTMDISQSTVLQGLFDLAQKYNAFIKFDTVNKKVSFYQPNNVGLNRGLKFQEKKFLDSVTVNINAEEQITRLKVYGQDGLEFRSLSPTGSNYIESFDYFMYPFECDVNYNVIKHSDYMSDGLCIAILKYKKKLLDNQSRFDSLVQQKTLKEQEIFREEQLLSGLNIVLMQLQDQQWVLNKTYGDRAPNYQEWQNVTSRITSQKNSIAAKENLITTLKSQLNNIKNSITSLGNLLKTENNFTANELKELNDFILVGEHTNDSIVDEKDLWEEAKEVFDTLNEPTINVTLSVEGYIESLRDKLKPAQISIGDITSLVDDELRINLRLKTIEISVDFDNEKIDLTIANGRDIQDVNSKWEKLLYDASSTSTVVNMEKYSYRKGEKALDGVSQILDSEYDTSKKVLKGGFQNTTEINHRGLYSGDSEDEDTYLVINNGLLAITKDNGNSIEVAISKNGVHAERVVGRLLLGNAMYIEDDSGTVSIKDGAVTVNDLNDRERVVLGKYRDPDTNENTYGMLIDSGAIKIINGLPKDEIDPIAVSYWDGSEERANNYSSSLFAMTEDRIVLEVERFDESIARLDLRADKIVQSVEDLEDNVHSVITQTADTIRSEVNASLANQYTTIKQEYTSAITQTATGIITRVTGVESSITNINSSMSTINQSLTSIQSTVSTQQISITNIGTRVTSAESIITQHATQISSKVSQTDYNGNTISSLINQTATSIKLKADKIDLEGAVFVNGSISGATSINVTTNVKVGNRLTVGNDYTTIEASFGGLLLSSWGDIEYIGSNHLFRGRLDFTDVSAISWGNNRPVAVFG